MNRQPNTSQFSNKRLRDLERIVHIAGGVLLLVFIYSPWSDSASFTFVMRALIFPVLVGSGAAMWQLPRVRRWLESRHAANRPS